jgi:hypothetical protein
MVCLRRCIVVAIDGAWYDVDVSPYGGEKKNGEVAGDVLCRTTLSWRHIIGMTGKYIHMSGFKLRERTGK